MPPDWTLFVKVILCMAFARTAAMAFNRYADRHIDIKNERTRSREIPSGKIPASAVLLLVIASSTLFILTSYYINTICFYLSPVALAVVLGYSLTKRFTALCHFILGLGLSLAPIGAYLAVTGEFNSLPLFFSACVLTWVSGFDIIYALQDSEFDKEQKLFSVPAAYGSTNALRISAIVHIASAAFLFAAGFAGSFGTWYWAGTAVFTALLFYQHSLIKPNDFRKVNVAFFTTNGFASVFFSIFVIIELMK